MLTFFGTLLLSAISFYQSRGSSYLCTSIQESLIYGVSMESYKGLGLENHDIGSKSRKSIPWLVLNKHKKNKVIFIIKILTIKN